MQISFYKYHGAGNDFVMIDNRTNNFKNDTKLIKWLCDRRFGIGGDGLILLEESNQVEAHFKMIYFNADGRESTMCGNGGRCIVAFAQFLGIIDHECIFEAIDGLHEANVEGDTVNLKMIDVDDITQSSQDCFLDTGSPHHVQFVDNLDAVDIEKQGSKIRFDDRYKTIGGANINFVEVRNSDLNIRTYERGVEAETLACGTGITAAAIAAALTYDIESPINVKAIGGGLSVSFRRQASKFNDVWLKGPAKQVFKGIIDVK
ncbi:diaminopimelate epimerase [Psychroflexus sp. ALD_RP9]|uniref:diaminopimelate epimerase n=1 Tax=Psychroflexus sp. ALD_RP9 TaxID=2777186 RepID=UPI001A8D72A0|nr:diaminopimelate epimerase [Psychroflexus sp. ALD_RP9]QSS96747.1 diaminopimelate epimerase [Psychroflexus sp. ALD_RP9]